MNLFEQTPFPEKTPELAPQDFLQILYAHHDMQGAGSQFDNPTWWNNQLINMALNIVSGAQKYCHSTGDTQSAHEISQINWEKRWYDNAGDIAADLNFIYHILSGENPSSQIYDKSREDFLLNIFEKREAEKPLFVFPKDTIPAETINEHSSLEEFNNALRKAFVAESKRQTYAPKNLEKLTRKSQ